MNPIDELDRIEELLALAGDVDPTDEAHVALLERRDEILHDIRLAVTGILRRRSQ